MELSRRLKYWFDHLGWQTLRQMVSSRAAQSTKLFPLVGYIVLVSDTIKGFFAQQEITRGSTLFSLDDRMLLIYFGLFSIGIGVVLYNVFCPYLIRRFVDENDCARSYMQMANTGQVYAMLIAVLGTPEKSPNPMHRELHRRLDEFDQDPSAWRVFLDNHREEIFEFYVHFYDNDLTARPVARAACSIWLFGGITMLMLPSLDTFFAVCRVFLKNYTLG